MPEVDGEGLRQRGQRAPRERLDLVGGWRGSEAAHRRGIGARRRRLQGCPPANLRLHGPLPAICGAVAEWSKALAWKVSIRQNRIEGSNPSRSARILFRACRGRHGW